MASSPEQNHHLSREIEGYLKASGFSDLSFPDIWKDIDARSPETIGNYIGSAFEAIHQGEDAFLSACTALSLVLELQEMVPDDERKKLVELFEELKSLLIAQFYVSDRALSRYNGFMRLFPHIRNVMTDEEKEEFDRFFQQYVLDEDYPIELRHNLSVELGMAIPKSISSIHEIIKDTRKKIEDALSDDSDFPEEV